MMLAAVVVIGALAALAFGFRSTEFLITELAAIGALWAIDRFWSAKIDRWDRGATGEEHVGGVIDRLAASGWRAIHDVSLGRGNVDHVLVGPAGLLTVETKSHGGRIAARGIDRRMLSQSYAEAKLIERITGREVSPLLVFSRAYLTPAVSRQRGVVVLPARMLAGHLARRPAVLAPEEVETLHARLLAALPD